MIYGLLIHIDSWWFTFHSHGLWDFSHANPIFRMRPVSPGGPEVKQAYDHCKKPIKKKNWVIESEVWLFHVISWL